MIILAVLSLMAALTMWANHPWLTRVYRYQPAPGQFINTLPVCRVGEPVDSVLARCQRSICGRIDTTTVTIHGQTTTRVDTVWAESMISLGGYGGYVIVGFDHPVINMHTYDFEIQGNAFVSDQNSHGGSSEPGIVMVGVDSDGDGVPSAGDRWYELAGSEYNHAKTQKGFEITYYRPDDDVDTPNVRWTCNSVDSLQEGYVHINSFHTQPYWPLWVDGDKMTFTGTKLRCNALDVKGNGTYFIQYFFDWGYVDNRVDYDWQGDYDQAVRNKMNLGFDLDWAVDADGNAVHLTHVDFIKVYCGILQECGWLGETSTEVKGAIDLHPDAPLPQQPQVVGDVNGDNTVDVGDVNLLINIMLGKAATSPAADLTGDGSVDVGDVNMVINIMLGKQ